MKTIEAPDRLPPNSEISFPPDLPKQTTRIKVALFLLLGALVVAGIAFLVIPSLFRPASEDLIRASGRIEGREVRLAPKEIQGRIRNLYVDEGTAVEQGQILAELESNQLEARASSLEANVSNLDAQIQQVSTDIAYTTKSTDASIAAAEAAAGTAEAHVERARAVLATSSVEYERARGLSDQGIIPNSELDQATMTLQTSRADLNAAEKEVLQAQASLAVTTAARDTVVLKTQQMRALQQARRAALAQVAEANANLSERKIVAPISGTILSRPVEVGDVVSPGSPIFVMVDMHRLYLKVYIPEPEIPKLKLGGIADITVDAFPGRSFAAQITKIYQQAEFTPKNVETTDERVKLVFGVELTLSNDEGLLKPGMPADCAIHWETAPANQVHDEP